MIEQLQYTNPFEGKYKTKVLENKDRVHILDTPNKCKKALDTLLKKQLLNPVFNYSDKFYQRISQYPWHIPGQSTLSPLKDLSDNITSVNKVIQNSTKFTPLEQRICYLTTEESNLVPKNYTNPLFAVGMKQRVMAWDLETVNRAFYDPKYQGSQGLLFEPDYMSKYKLKPISFSADKVRLLSITILYTQETFVIDFYKVLSKEVRLIAESGLMPEVAHWFYDSTDQGTYQFYNKTIKKGIRKTEQRKLIEKLTIIFEDHGYGDQSKWLVSRAIQEYTPIFTALQTMAQYGIIAGHNISFDAAFLYRYLGIRVVNPWDTMTFFYMYYISQGRAMELRKFGSLFKKSKFRYEGYAQQSAGLKDVYEASISNPMFEMDKSNQLYNYNKENLPEDVLIYSAKDTKVFTELMYSQIADAWQVAEHTKTDEPITYYDMLLSNLFIEGSYENKLVAKMIPYAVEREFKALGTVARMNAMGLPINAHKLYYYWINYKKELKEKEEAFLSKYNVNPYSPTQLAQMMGDKFPELSNYKQVDIKDLSNASGLMVALLFADYGDSLMPRTLTKQDRDLFYSLAPYIKPETDPVVEEWDEVELAMYGPDELERRAAARKKKELDRGLDYGKKVVAPGAIGEALKKSDPTFTGKVSRGATLTPQQRQLIQHKYGSLKTDTKNLKKWLLESEDVSPELEEFATALIELRGIKKRLDKLNELKTIVDENIDYYIDHVSKTYLENYCIKNNENLDLVDIYYPDAINTETGYKAYKDYYEGKYDEPLPEMIIHIPISVRSYGTITGRMASINPNVQNISPEVRATIEAAPGRTIICGDLPQIELRIAAALAYDVNMLTALLRGIDLHILTASRMLNVPFEKVTKKQRKKAKPVNFGTLYGQTAPGLKNYAESVYGVEMTEDEAKQAIFAYLSTYQHIAYWQMSAEIDAFLTPGNKPISRTTLGGRIFRWYPKHYVDASLVKHDAMREKNTYRKYRLVKSGLAQLRRHILNYQDQGSGADILKELLVRVEEYMWTHPSEWMQLANVVHDEIVVESTTNHPNMQEIGDTIGEIMQASAEHILANLKPLDTYTVKLDTPNMDEDNFAYLKTIVAKYTDPEEPYFKLTNSTRSLLATWENLGSPYETIKNPNHPARLASHELPIEAAIPKDVQEEDKKHAPKEGLIPTPVDVGVDRLWIKAKK